MSTHYRQLTLGQRYQIQALLIAGLTNAEIARQLNCHRSTIGRERSRCPGRYRAKKAQGASDCRRQAAHKRSCFSPELWARLKRNLSRHLSPEMVAGRMRLEEFYDLVSTSTIYRWIHRDWAQGGTVYRHLTRALRPYRRRYGVRHRHDPLGERASIHDRPKVVEQRQRLGDWEGDTMYARAGYLVTLVDRASNYFLARKVPNRTRQKTREAIVGMLRGQPVHTLTLDNGVEFCEHRMIAAQAKLKIYFADPYASWQRGCNENANGRLRRYIPRTTNLAKLSTQKLRRLVEKLNHQPRKRLAWKTPSEVFNNVSVAVIV